MGLDVLIADRDVELAKLYGRFLAGHGFSTATAASGLECLGRVHQQAPQVLVLDRELPWGDATGVLACLREDGLSLPVILTTWNAAPNSDRRLVVPPVVFRLSKHLPLRALLGGIQFAANSNRSRVAFADRRELSQHGDPTRIQDELERGLIGWKTA